MKFVPAALALLALLAPGVRAETRTHRLPLADLAGQPTGRLVCAKAAHGLKVPIPERWAVTGAALHLKVVTSSALVPERSQLAVTLDGRTVGQLRPTPEPFQGSADLALPGRLLAPGYRDLVFHVAQHTAAACEDPCAPELWTELDWEQSYLDLTYDDVPVPLSLSRALGHLFDPRLSPRGEVTVVAEAGLWTPAAVAVSGVARRFEYRPVAFGAAAGLAPGRDHLVVGTTAFVRALLEPRGVAVEGGGPRVQVAHLPVSVPSAQGGGYRADPRFGVVIVAGDDPDQVVLAAQALGVVTLPYPDGPRLAPAALELPAGRPYGGPGVVEPGREVSLHTLGFSTRTFRGMGPGVAEIEFRLPSDLLIKPNQYAHLVLNLAWGVGARADSAFNVALNGQGVAAVALDGGGALVGHRVQLPTYLFRAGRNTLTFAPVLIPPTTGPCTVIRDETLFVTAFGDSRLSFPAMPHWVELPRLDLVFREGFPLGRWPDGRETALVLGATDPDTLSAAWNLVGLATRSGGYPLFRLQAVAPGQPEPADRELLVVGPAAALPERHRQAAPVSFTDPSVVSYPQLTLLTGEKERGAGEKLREAVFGFLGRTQAKPAVASARVVQDLGLGAGRGAVAQFEVPGAPGRSAVVVTAAGAADLGALGRALLAPAVLGQLQGGLALVDLAGEEPAVVSAQTSRRYYSGRLDGLARFDYLVHQHLWLYLGLCLALLVGLSALVYRRLRRRRAVRVAGG